jgi:protocatechuate 3,4-dioxygenase beta subunit
MENNAPYPGIIIYAYHTDNKGYYSKRGNETGVQKWHGHLYGYCKTDPDGRYEIHTIKPARYPSNDFPAHIHWYIKEPDGKMEYLNDFVFSDDSLVTQKYIASLADRGDNGIIELEKNSNGIYEGERITILKRP